MCARRRSNFLLSRQEKVTKEKATLLCVSLRCATGNLRCSVRGCAAELTARCALRSNNCGESVHEVRVSCGTRTHPLPCASRHAQKGTRNRTSTRAIASLGPVCAGASASRCAIQAERSDGPYGCWAVGLLGCWAVGLLGCWAATPLLYAPGARRRRGGVGVPQDTPALRQLTRRVCLNGAPQARSELRGAPRIRAPQVAP